MSTYHFREQPNSRTGDNTSQTRRYVSTGSNDEVGVRQVAKSLIPPAIITADGFLYRQNISTDDVLGSIVYLSAVYGKQQREEGTYSWTFDGTGGTLHIKTAKSSINKYPGTAKPSYGVIGANGDDVAGADIVFPTGKITVNFTHPTGVITLPRMFAINELTGTVNSTTMLTRAAGEVLFMGPRGSDGSEAPATIDYTFAHQKNLQSIVVDTITGIACDGWDVSWIKWTDDDTDDKPGEKPKAVYIERVYERVDQAALLGFGN